MDFLLDVFFPAACPLCGELLDRNQLICCRCARTTRPIRGPRCKKCGAPLPDREAEYCVRCEQNSHAFSRGISVFAYRGPMRKAVADFKYKNRRCYATFFTEAMWQTHGSRIAGWAPDAVIPIPLHRKKEKKRGFNQAWLLAAPIAERLGVPAYEHGLLRVTATQAQKTLDRKKRQINLKRAFKIGTNDVKLKHILLIDDIYTTGSTVDAAASVLLENGAAQVSFFTLCAGEGEERKPAKRGKENSRG